jgi:two-component system cell cycle sensor histidine kinase/response regulator CckA
MGRSEVAEELNRRLFEAMPGGVVHVGVDGAIRMANAAALRLLGFSFDAATSRYTQDWENDTVREDGSPCPVSEYPVTKALTTGLAQPPMTIGVRAPGGELRWAVFTAIPIHADGELTGAIVTFLDVTEQRRAAAALAESEARLRSILESAPNFVISSDREGRITYVNREPPNLSRAELMGRFAWDCVGQADRETVRNAVREIVTTGAVVEYESSGVGTQRYQVGAGPIRVGGEIVGITFIAWDVTRQKQLESRVAISDRLATVGTLAAGVAHEINNPLTYLLANLEWLERDLPREPSDSRERVALASAIEGATRIRDVVRDLGSLSSVDAGRVASLDVRLLLDTALRMADHETRYRAQVRRRYDDVPRVVANESRLGQVFLNLIINAAQAISEGDAAENEIVVSTRGEGERVIVEVSDTGAGIPAELVGKIFEPFVTTKPKGMGTGLGLHIARSIVTSLGGEIRVESEVGIGTTVRVSLPAAIAASAVPPVARPPATIPVAGRLRFLVVDDEPRLTNVLEDLLSEHQVTTSNSGRAALALLATHSYDVVLCDLVMPELTGMDVYDEVARRDPALASRIVFMTGGAFTERARDFLAHHDNLVLHKPFALDDLQDIIRRTAAQRR